MNFMLEGERSNEYNQKLGGNPLYGCHYAASVSVTTQNTTDTETGLISIASYLIASTKPAQTLTR